MRRHCHGHQTHDLVWMARGRQQWSVCTVLGQGGRSRDTFEADTACLVRGVCMSIGPEMAKCQARDRVCLRKRRARHRELEMSTPTLARVLDGDGIVHDVGSISEGCSTPLVCDLMWRGNHGVRSVTSHVSRPNGGRCVRML